MKLQFCFLAFVFCLASCKKDIEVSSVKNETGYLLSSIISGIDTTRFEYNNKNQLIKWTLGSFTVCDSFSYNASGQLLSCRYRYLHNGGSTLVHIACTYDNDTIIRTETNPLNSRYSHAIKYVLSNKSIIKAEQGGVYDGVTTFYDRNYFSYLYQDSNIINCIGPFVTQNYQPIDTFLYNMQFNNPYLTLGKHVWTLIRYNTSFSTDIVVGESKHIPFIENYATYSSSNGTLISSGMHSYKTTVIETAKESQFLPKAIKRIHDSGTETVMKFIYIKSK